MSVCGSALTSKCRFPVSPASISVSIFNNVEFFPTREKLKRVSNASSEIVIFKRSGAKRKHRHFDAIDIVNAGKSGHVEEHESFSIQNNYASRSGGIAGAEYQNAIRKCNGYQQSNCIIKNR
jgi:hypothetical protein